MSLVFDKVKKKIIDYLCPDLHVSSVTDIPLQSLKANGYTTLIFDLDNTLLSWRARDISNDILTWLTQAQKLGYKMVLLSNSLRRRVDRLSQTIGIPAISRAWKPRRSVFLEALQIARSTPKETVVVGDQLFTDVLGAKRNGLYTVLVVPIDRGELWMTRLVRIPERILLHLFHKRGFI